MKFQMFKLVLEKAEEPEIKLTWLYHVNTYEKCFTQLMHLFIHSLFYLNIQEGNPALLDTRDMMKTKIDMISASWSL